MDEYCLPLVDTIVIPKNVRIKNVRLGILYTGLTAGAVIWSFVSIVTFRSYESYSVPSGNMFEMWPYPGDRDRIRNRNLSYCTNAASYNYTYSDLYTYEMSGCEQLPYGETYSRTSAGLFFPTSIDDTYVWTFGAAKCGPGLEAESVCKKKHGKLIVDFTSGEGVACQCLRYHSFFPLGPEEQFIFFTHGYEAGNMGVMGNGRMRGTSRTSSNQFFDSSSKWKDMEDGGVLTIIQDDAGVECKLGASSRYTPAQALNGIGASLRDYLACAGATLEMQDEQVKSGHKQENIVPHARITGLEIKIALDYKNTHGEPHNGVVCYVRISAQQKWNAENNLHYEAIPEADAYESHYRARVARGINAHLVPQGRLDFFDFNQLTTAIVNAFVIIGMPATVVALLALYCLGAHSAVYFAAQSSTLNIVSECKAACTRLMAAYASFLTIPGSADGVMSKRDVTDMLQKIVSPHIRDGTLSRGEVAQLAAFTVEGLDGECHESLDPEAYLKSIAYDESVQLKDLAALFDNERRKGHLEQFFQDCEFAKRRGAPSTTSAPAFSRLRNVMVVSRELQSWVPKSRGSKLDIEGPSTGEAIGRDTFGSPVPDETKSCCSLAEPACATTLNAERCDCHTPRQASRKQTPWSPGDCARLLANAKETGRKSC